MYGVVPTYMGNIFQMGMDWAELNLCSAGGHCALGASVGQPQICAQGLQEEESAGAEGYWAERWAGNEKGGEGAASGGPASSQPLFLAWMLLP